MFQQPILMCITRDSSRVGEIGKQNVTKGACGFGVFFLSIANGRLKWFVGLLYENNCSCTNNRNKKKIQQILHDDERSGWGEWT